MVYVTMRFCLGAVPIAPLPVMRSLGSVLNKHELPLHPMDEHIRTLSNLLFSAVCELPNLQVLGLDSHATVPGVGTSSSAYKVPYILQFYVYDKSFICNSYKKCRGMGSIFPLWNSPQPLGDNVARLG